MLSLVPRPSKWEIASHLKINGNAFTMSLNKTAKRRACCHPMTSIGLGQAKNLYDIYKSKTINKSTLFISRAAANYLQLLKNQNNWYQHCRPDHQRGRSIWFDYSASGVVKWIWSLICKARKPATRCANKVYDKRCLQPVSKSKRIAAILTLQDNKCRQLKHRSKHYGSSEPNATFTVQPNERGIQWQAGERAESYYPYQAYLETLINSSKETQQTRLFCERWTKDSRTYECHRRRQRERRSSH